MIFTIIFLLLQKALGFSCYDQNNNPVSFISIIKYPESVLSTQKKTFAYFTSKSKQIQTSNDPIDEEGGALQNILDKAKGNILAWNDEIPGEKSTTNGGHSKGILYYDEKSDQGFYLIHSVPGWPIIKKSGIDAQIEHKNNIYGQQFIQNRSFLCLSLTGKQIDELSKGLLIIRPQIYYNTMQNTKLPNLQELANREKGQHYSDEDYLFTNFDIGSSVIKSIYKSPKYEQQIFELVLETFKDKIMVESWGRPYSENSQKVINIDFIKIEDAYWSSTQDHSKWLILQNQNWVCIGDLNNMESQIKRGGSFHCINNSSMHDSFKQIIAKENISQNFNFDELNQAQTQQFKI